MLQISLGDFEEYAGDHNNSNQMSIPNHNRNRSFRSLDKHILKLMLSHFVIPARTLVTRFKLPHYRQSLGDEALAQHVSYKGTDHSQNPSTITYIKYPKEKIHCADKVYL